MENSVKNYIKNNWDICVRYTPEDKEDLIGMPYPYTVPAVGHFDEMYYWDTYFTNKGLEADGKFELVKNNTDNILFLVNKYGFMPNGNRTKYLDGSQPPFLSLMVRDVYEHYKDEKWLEKAYSVLEIEYEFWQKKRISSIGLNCYFGNSNPITAREFIDYFENRVGFKFEGTLYDKEHHYRATGESGWDVSPRFDNEAHHFAPVDLNSLMYMFEINMTYFSKTLKNNDDEVWNNRAKKRKEKMIKYLLTNDGIFLDYNYVTKKHSKVFSAASYFPLFAELVDKEQAEIALKNLKRLETEYGILCCEKKDIDGIYQWGYPNGWACLQYTTVLGLIKYGYYSDAMRLTEKFLRLVDNVFSDTGKLWEKYNVIEGNINVTNEYEMPEMMGWTAGVYRALQEIKFG